MESLRCTHTPHTNVQVCKFSLASGPLLRLLQLLQVDPFLFIPFYLPVCTFSQRLQVKKLFLSAIAGTIAMEMIQGEMSLPCSGSTTGYKLQQIIHIASNTGQLVDRVSINSVYLLLNRVFPGWRLVEVWSIKANGQDGQETVGNPSVRVQS